MPDSLVDELLVHGSPGACRDHVEAYREAGVTTPVLMLIAPDDTRGLHQPSPRQAAAALRDLATRSVREIW